MSNIFTGLKIIDCTKVFSGPFASRYFADYGAEVIKIESLENYDESRNFTPLKNGKSGYFEILNRGKKSITLNLKDKNDLNMFYNLIKESDIFLENFSPKIKKKLKIDYEVLSDINPKLIYGSLNGYGENIDKKAYDIIIQAESGLSSLNGETKPMKNATAIIDTFSGLSLSLAISSLLYKREITGKGDFVNIPMVACGIQLLEQNLIETSIKGKNPSLTGNHDNAIFPFGFFKTKNGEIVIAIGNDNLWQIFTKNLIPELFGKYNSNQERLDNKNYLISLIENVFLNYTKEELNKMLDDLGIPNGKINKMQDLLNDKILYENNFIKKLNHEELGEIVIPYEFIKYKSYKIEEIKKAPKLGENNQNYNINK
ncbi:MAG: CoA transferase [Candidatus Gracilibacteria bacterium]|nr:CoA transferase [Candidatus Gracilibacteria bacterium]